MSDSTIFFLHGGPAMGAAMERASFPESQRGHWWDQPRPAPGARQPYRDLLDASEAELRRVARERGTSLVLLANSFGAVLAAHLAQVAPELIERIVLSAPVADLELALLRVARRVAALATPPATQLRAALARYDEAPARQQYWAVMDLLLPHPQLSQQYWLPASPQADWFAQMLGRPEMFDFAAHLAIADDYQRTPLPAQPSPFTGPVELLLGVADPLADPAATADWWRRCFPQASVRLVTAGHFPHLELPQETLRIFGA